MPSSQNAPFQPGPRLIDGSELNSAFAQPVQSVESGATALGTTIADAFQLRAAITHFGTVAASTGAVLRRLPNGGIQTVYNAGASTLQVYAWDGATIDGIAGTTGVTLAAGARGQFTRLADGNWVSALLGAAV